MFTKDQGKIKIMFQGAIQKNQNIKKKKKNYKSQRQYGILWVKKWPEAYMTKAQLF